MSLHCIDINRDLLRMRNDGHAETLGSADGDSGGSLNLLSLAPDFGQQSVMIPIIFNS